MKQTRKKHSPVFKAKVALATHMTGVLGYAPRQEHTGSTFGRRLVYHWRYARTSNPETYQFRPIPLFLFYT